MFRQGGKILNDFWRYDLGEMLHIIIGPRSDYSQRMSLSLS